MTRLGPFIFLASICSLLLACTTATPIVGPDGTENQLISCPTSEDCYDKAHEVCRGPYKIVNTSSEINQPGGTTTIKLLVKCGF